MKSITIHGLDDQLSKKISEKSQREGLSQNRTIKILLQKALGLSPQNAVDNSDAFSEFVGLWSQKEADAFDAAIADFEVIQQEDWG